MKRLIFVLLLTGCSYSKSQIDTVFIDMDKRIKEIAELTVANNQGLTTVKEKLWPEAMKVSKENNSCAVDLKTNKCVE
jgi:hypothetical protein